MFTNFDVTLPKIKNLVKHKFSKTFIINLVKLFFSKISTKGALQEYVFKNLFKSIVDEIT